MKVVIGAYISGTLHREGKDFLLLEASEKLGGRHLTVKDKCDKVMYEAGAWRNGFHMSSEMVEYILSLLYIFRTGV